MKDFDYYSRITSTYYVRSDFRVTTWVSGGKVFAKQIGNGKIYYTDGREYPMDELKVLQAMKKTVESDDAFFAAAIKPYRDEQARLHTEFEKDLYEDLGIEDNPKKEKLFTKAWEFGHSSGYSEVYNYACDLVDLID